MSLLDICFDNIKVIIDYLDRNECIYLLHTCRKFYKMMNIFYNKYYIDHNKLLISYRKYYNKIPIYDIKKISNIKSLDTFIKIQLFINFESIQFDRYFNESIDILQGCDNLKLIHFGSMFNNLQKCIKLKTIIFGTYFNQNIDNLPDSIEYIIFRGLRSNFDKSIEKYPNKLKEIQYSDRFDQDIINLPNTIKKIIITNVCYDKFEFINKLPNTKHIIAARDIFGEGEY